MHQEIPVLFRVKLWRFFLCVQVTIVAIEWHIKVDKLSDIKMFNCPKLLAAIFVYNFYKLFLPIKKEINLIKSN